MWCSVLVSRMLRFFRTLNLAMFISLITCSVIVSNFRFLRLSVVPEGGSLVYIYIYIYVWRYLRLMESAKSCPRTCRYLLERSLWTLWCYSALQKQIQLYWRILYGILNETLFTLLFAQTLSNGHVVYPAEGWIPEGYCSVVDKSKDKGRKKNNNIVLVIDQKLQPMSNLIKRHSYKHIGTTFTLPLL